MKKYSSGSFVDAAVRVYGSEADTISSFPASIIGNGGNITPWTIYGNTSGANSVGEVTGNLVNISDFTATTTPTQQDKLLWTGTLPVGTYTFSINQNNAFTGSTRNTIHIKVNDINYYENPTTNYHNNSGQHIYTFTIEDSTATVEIYYWTNAISNDCLFTQSMLNTGDTALPYEPYGYKLPVVIGSTTTNIYVADVLRKSSGADPVYDVMSSTGVITRNVDTDGSPLPTPTTESFTAPTLATVAGSQTFNIDTTLKPSSVSLTYTGWHTHTDKQYSGGQWGQVTSNAKVLRRKKSAKSKT